MAKVRGIDKTLLKPGSAVRVTDGPFNNFRTSGEVACHQYAVTAIGIGVMPPHP